MAKTTRSTYFASVIRAQTRIIGSAPLCRSKLYHSEAETTLCMWASPVTRMHASPAANAPRSDIANYTRNLSIARRSILSGQSVKGHSRLDCRPSRTDDTTAWVEARAWAAAKLD